MDAGCHFLIVNLYKFTTSLYFSLCTCFQNRDTDFICLIGLLKELDKLVHIKLIREYLTKK